MVLKALFVGSALDPIVGLDARRQSRAGPHARATTRTSAGPRAGREPGAVALRRPATRCGAAGLWTTCSSRARPERKAAALALREARIRPRALLRIAARPRHGAARRADWQRLATAA